MFLQILLPSVAVLSDAGWRRPRIPTQELILVRMDCVTIAADQPWLQISREHKLCGSAATLPSAPNGPAVKSA